MNKEGGQATSGLYVVDQKKADTQFFYVLDYIQRLGYIALRLGTPRLYES